MAEDLENAGYYADTDEDDEELYDEDDFENTDIINYLYYVCGYLMETDYHHLEKEEVLSTLEMMQEELTQIKAEYDIPSPDGSNGARETMLEIVDTLANGIDELTGFLTEKDDERIENGVELLETADMMIDILKDIIARQRVELSDLMSRLNQGELKEGEPVTDENQGFFLTDEDV